LNLHPQRPGRGLDLSHEEHRVWIGGIPEDRHAGDAGQELLDELQPFPSEIRSKSAQPGDISSRPRETGDEPRSNGISRRCHHDGDRLGCALGSKGPGRTRGHDDIHLETDELRREVWERLGLAVRITVLDHDVLTFHVAEVAQPLPERLDDMWGGGGRCRREKTYPRHLSRLLRLGGERRGEQRGRTSQERAPVHHSIT
jgi:hypothetical protein